MDGSMAHTGHRSSNLREKELPGAGQSSNVAELDQMLDNPEPDVGSAASTGRKRRPQKPTLTPEEKRRRKIDGDKNYRRRRKVIYERLMKIATEYGGIDQMEFDFPRLMQIKSKHGKLEEIEFKLNKLEQMEAEQAVLLGDKYNIGANSVNSDNEGSIDDRDLLGDHGISQMLPALNSDVQLADFNAELENGSWSNVDFSSFNGLDWERQEVNANVDAHGDVTENCLLGPSVEAERCNQGCLEMFGICLC